MKALIRSLSAAQDMAPCVRVKTCGERHPEGNGIGVITYMY